MKTTIERPNAKLRQAKTLANSGGVTLKRFSSEAPDEHLRRCSGELGDGKPEAPWMAGFGALLDLADENRRILGVIEQEFETIAPEDVA